MRTTKHDIFPKNTQARDVAFVNAAGCNVEAAGTAVLLLRNRHTMKGMTSCACAGHGMRET
ncbi:hypothetical protein [Nonomuraea sp. SYSU D8015]|uniref:hypothetical protein n=1 Tax=Nonomuraea sp. SYSU D8015 TaxID=2593644 RepID=UPI0016602C60|nr:hypothetical protein [Nonomuraea sp. SYSU D8015]